jgi:cob(I)alamin adenosyltransferase
MGNKTSGYVQVYTGNGKGKTTAALGLALRAVGAGKRVFVGQFAKGRKGSECVSLKLLGKRVTVEQYGLKSFIVKKPSERDVRAARRGLRRVKNAVMSGRFDLVVLDEGNIATYYKLFSVNELLALLDSRPPDVEVVITGRYADRKIIARADLVTEMREIKHYWRKGVGPRHGIEK